MTPRTRSRRGARALALGVVLALGVAGGCRDPLPTIVTIEPFQLVDEAGRPFSRDALLGRVWVVDFFFTHCPTICPVLTGRMKEVQSHFADRRDELGLASFSVDPASDTPDVLRRYAEHAGADLSRWRFVTGPTEELARAAARGFRVAMGERVGRDDGAYDIMHSSHLILVDREARIRGYYGADPAGMEALLRDAERLLDESPRAATR